MPTPQVGRIRRRVGKLLRHRYTRVPHIDVLDSATPPVGDGLDVYGEAINVFGPAVSGQVCLYDSRGAVSTLRLGHGTLEVSVPTLFVPFDDPLQTNDKVLNVLDPIENRVLLKEAIVDSTYTDEAAAGRLAYRTLQLREMVMP